MSAPLYCVHSPIVRAIRWGECHEEVSRRGVAEPCNKTAVGLRYDPEENQPYPVCSRHARGEMVPLFDLIEAARAVRP